MEAVKSFDYIGFVLYAGGLILVLLGLCEFSPYLPSFDITHRLILLSLGWSHICLELAPCGRNAGCWICFTHCIYHLWCELLSNTTHIDRNLHTNNWFRNMGSARATTPARVTAQEPGLQRDCLLGFGWEYGILLDEVGLGTIRQVFQYETNVIIR